MHKQNDIRKLLIKFVNNECSEQEYEEVLHYFQGNHFSGEMPTVDEVLEILGDRKSLDEFAAKRIYQKIISPQIETSKQKSNIWNMYRGIWKYAAAAIIILLVFAGILHEKGYIFSDFPRDMLNKDTGFERTELITLELGNGQIEEINTDGSRTVHDVDGNVIGQQEKSRLVYSADQPVENFEYNTLRIPYSKQFEIELSDGTVVHLNSGTTIKFPAQFPENADRREVEVTGEAYFEVAHNKEQPFVVNAGEIDIRVLGTKFNLSTYPEDDRTDVVLVEGSVSLDTKNKESEIENEQVLKPGYRASFHKLDNSIEMMKVPTSIYTSWINGELVFRDMKFEDILLKLERKYNVSIHNSNSALSNERFNASFDDVSLQTVLKYFEAIYYIEFSMENGTVLIQ